MSTSIDERVVEMRFDNKNFEENAQTSLSTLEKLKNAINIGSVGEWLENLGTVDVDGMNNLASATESTSSKFSALQTIATGALLEIGRKASDAAMKLLDQVNPLNQVAAGWQGYADKTSAVQTIMAATREQFSDTTTQMQVVEEQLNRLNWFSDETSYSFLDMTSNVGKFTSQGISLEDSVTAMQGISTWAALSGANVQEASRAMYNLAQALGTGTVKLIDWKSIENANMATVEFKQTAIDTAESMGILTKVEDGLWKTQNGLTVSVENFNENLTKGAWFTNDVLTASLDKYGKFSVELNKFQTLTGDYYNTTSKVIKDLDAFSTADSAEQLKILQRVSNATGVSIEDLRQDFEYLNGAEFELGKRAFKAAQEAKTFSEAIDSVKDAAKTAWMNVFEAIFGNYNEAKRLWTDLSNNLWDVFVGPISDLAAVLAEWKGLGGRDLLFGIEDVDPGIIGNITNAISSLFNALFAGLSVFENDTDIGEVLYNLTKKFHDWTESMVPSEETLEKISAASTKFFTVIKKVTDGIKNFTTGIVNSIKNSQLLRSTVSLISTTFTSIVRTIGQVVSAFGRLIKGVAQSEGLQKFVGLITDVKNAIGGFIQTNIIDRLTNGMNGLAKVLHFNGEINVSGVIDFISAALSNLVDWCYSAKDAVVDFISRVQNSAVWQQVVAIFERIRDAFTTGLNWLKSEKAAEKIEELTKKFKDLITRLKPGPKTIETLTKVGIALLTVLKTIGTVLAAVVGVVITLGIKLVEWLKNSNLIQKAISGIKTLLEKLGPLMEKVIEHIKTFFANLRDSDKFKSFVEWLTKVKDIFLEFVQTKIIENIVEWFKKFNEVSEETGKSKFTEWGEKAWDILQKLVEWFKKGVDAVKEFANSIKESDIVKQLVTIFEHIKNGEFTADDITGLFSLIKEKVIEGLKNLIHPLEEGDYTPAKLFEKGKAALSNLASGLLEGWEGVDLSGLWDVLKRGSLFFILIAIGLFLVKINQFASSVVGLPKSITETLSSLQGVIKAYQDQLKAETIIKIAEAIAIIAGTVVVLGLVDPTLVGRGMLWVGILVLIMKTLMSSATDFLNSKADAGAQAVDKVALNMSKAAKRFATLAGLGVALLGVAGAVAILAAVVDKIGNMKTDVAIQGALGVLALAAVLTAAMGALMAINKATGSNGFGGMAVATSMIGLALAINLLVGPLEKLSAIKFGSLMSAAIAISGVAAALGYASSVANPVGMLTLSAGILAVSAALAILRAATKDLKSGDLTKVAQALGVLEVAILGLEGLAFIAQKVAAGLAILSWSLLKLGASILFAGGGIALLGVGIKIIAEAIVPAAEGLVEASGVIKEGSDDIVAAFEAIYTGIVGVLNEQLPQTISMAIAAVGFIIEGVLLYLSYAVLPLADELIKIIINLVKAVGIALGTNEELYDAVSIIVDGIIIAFEDIFFGAVGGILGAIPGVGTKAEKWWKGVASEFTSEGRTKLEGAKAEMEAETSTMFGGFSFTEAFDHFKEGGFNLFGNFRDGMGEGSALAQEEATTAVNNVGSEVETSIETYGPAMRMRARRAAAEGAAGVEEGTSGIQTTVDETLAGITNAIDLQSPLFTTGMTGMSAEGFTGFTTNMEGLLSWMTELMSNVTGVVDASSIDNATAWMNVEDAGIMTVDSYQEPMLLSSQALTDKYGEGITSKTEEITRIEDTMVTTAKEQGMDIHAQDYYDEGVEHSTNYGQGQVDNIDIVVEKTEEVTSASVGKLNEAQSEAHSAGGFFGQGFANGIQSMVETVASAAANLASRATSALKGLLGINSPSKVAIWMGNMVDEGLAIGFQNEANVPQKAARDLAKTSVNAIQDALQNADAVLSDSISPTITPVLDLSAVQRGANAINGMLGSTHKLGAMANGVDATLTAGKLASTNTSPISNTNTTTNNFSINVTGGPNASARDIANEVMDRINNDLQRRKAAFA